VDAEPYVSVIVPFWGTDVEQLRRCLAALGEQTFPRERFEVIVVDNHATPDDRVAAVKPAGCVLLHEPRPGSYRARNRGLAQAKGEIIAFTDSDCRPVADWLAAGVGALAADPGLACVGGPITLTVRGTRPNPIEIYELCMGLNQAEYVAHGQFCATANLFTRRDTFERVGHFDPSVYSGGDRLWGERVTALGLRCGYTADAMVLHPARSTMGELIKRSRRVAAADLRRARISATSGWRRHLQRSWAECAFAVTRLRSLGTRRKEFGWPSTCGATLIAGIVVAVKLLECVRLTLGGRPQR